MASPFLFIQPGAPIQLVNKKVINYERDHGKDKRNRSSSSCTEHSSSRLDLRRSLASGGSVGSFPEQRLEIEPKSTSTPALFKNITRL